MSSINRKILFTVLSVFVFLFHKQIRAQNNIYVTTVALGPNGFDGALFTAMNSNSPVTIIHLQAPGLIQLTYNLPVVTMGPGKTLIIQKDPGYGDQGFDFTYFSVLPNSQAWYGPLPMVFDGGNNQKVAVELHGLKFKNYNKMMNAFFTNPAFIAQFPPWFLPQYPSGICSGGPDCVYAQNCETFIVENCIFENYTTGIRYRKIENLTIHKNKFTTDASSGTGCNVPADANAIVMRDMSLNINKLYSSTITSNTIIGSSSSLTYPGVGIYIDPFEWMMTGNNQLTNIDANLKFTITDNQIINSSNGIIQNPMQPNRTSLDPTYNMTIKTNTLLNTELNVGLRGPYRTFILDQNDFTLKNLSQNVPVSTPVFLGLGTFTWSSNNQTYPVITPGINSFGFKMVYPNTLNQPVFNNQNTFSFINNVNYTSDPQISVMGNFGQQVDFIGLNTNVFFNIHSGRNTNIRECLNNMNGIEVGNPPNSPVTAYSNPINLVTDLWSNPPTPGYTPSNGNLNAPTLKNARISNNVLKIAFDLTGSSIIPANGPYVVEFFKSNIKGELVNFIGKQTINTLTGNTYSLTIVPLPGVTMASGDRIGATLTSLGTNVNPPVPLGTSSVSYVYAIPCNDCISDFAPLPGKDYIISCWTKEVVQPQVSYGACQIKVTFYSALTPNQIQIGTPLLIGPSGPMVDNWQKIEGKLTVPVNATGIKIEFVNNSPYDGLFVDDVRFFPVDATMKSYAYDPDNMRLMGELDERNYATFYEYDEEGKLIRVKKETEKGIMTIKESRNSKPTKP